MPAASALNAINRSIGQPDLYPFRLTPGAAVKLNFVRRIVSGYHQPASAPAETAELKAAIAAFCSDYEYEAP